MGPGGGLVWGRDGAYGVCVGLGAVLWGRGRAVGCLRGG